MSVLMERSDQALPITEISRSAKKIIDNFVRGKKNKYVVMRNNTPAAVLMSIQYYEALMDLIADFQIEAVASERLKSFDLSKAITHEDMLKKLEKED